MGTAAVQRLAAIGRIDLPLSILGSRPARHFFLAGRTCLTRLSLSQLPSENVRPLHRACQTAHFFFDASATVARKEALAADLTTNLHHQTYLLRPAASHSFWRPFCSLSTATTLLLFPRTTSNSFDSSDPRGEALATALISGLIAHTRLVFSIIFASHRQHRLFCRHYLSIPSSFGFRIPTSLTTTF